MSLFTQLLIGSFMIGVTVFIHAIGLDFVIRHGKAAEGRVQRLTGIFWRPVLSCIAVISVFTLHVAQIWLWASLYLGLHCQPLNDFFTALYFSTSTYTTVGDSQVVLEQSCRMLGGVEGANGFLLFGWTTAFIFEMFAQFYRREAKSL